MLHSFYVQSGTVIIILFPFSFVAFLLVPNLFACATYVVNKDEYIHAYSMHIAFRQCSHLQSID